MKGYKITQEQKEMLEGTQMPDESFYNPVQDQNGNWFIFQEEFEACEMGFEDIFISPEPKNIL